MKDIQSLKIIGDTREELLPGYSSDMPCISSCAQLDKYLGRFAPWHWHKAVELFYVESGKIEYETSSGKREFPAGCGGLVNSNTLHMSRPKTEAEANIGLVHLFDPSFIAGHPGSRIDQKYVMPIITNPQIEIIPLDSADSKQALVLQMLRESFRMEEEVFGYEIRLRAALSDIWFQMISLARPLWESGKDYKKRNANIKVMMAYIQEHYGEKITVRDVAASAYLSERECFRTFHDCLHMTPVDYIRNCRLQSACRMLAEGQETITRISHSCGLGNSSYFGKIFREQMGCTPMEYRLKWRNSDR